MASAQSNRLANEPQGRSSLGQKLSNWIKGTDHNGQQSKPICQAQPQPNFPPNQGNCKGPDSHHPCQAEAKVHSPQKQEMRKAHANQTCHTDDKPMHKASATHHHTVHTHSHGHSHSHTKHQNTSGTACAVKNNARHGHRGHGYDTNGSVSCYGRREHKERNLLRRIKNRLSSNDNCSANSSTSSSDSESENGCRHKGKN